MFGGLLDRELWEDLRGTAAALESLKVADMASPKQTVLDLVRDLPEDASLEDIQYHLYADGAMAWRPRCR